VSLQKEKRPSLPLLLLMQSSVLTVLMPSNLAEMTEAIHVVTAIRGGASLVHGIQMRNIAEKLSM